MTNKSLKEEIKELKKIIENKDIDINELGFNYQIRIRALTIDVNNHKEIIEKLHKKNLNQKERIDLQTEEINAAWKENQELKRENERLKEENLNQKGIIDLQVEEIKASWKENKKLKNKKPSKVDIAKTELEDAIGSEKAKKELKEEEKFCAMCDIKLKPDECSVSSCSKCYNKYAFYTISEAKNKKRMDKEKAKKELKEEENMLHFDDLDLNEKQKEEAEKLLKKIKKKQIKLQTGDAVFIGKSQYYTRHKFFDDNKNNSYKFYKIVSETGSMWRIQQMKTTCIIKDGLKIFKTTEDGLDNNFKLHIINISKKRLTIKNTDEDLPFTYIIDER